MASKPTKRRKLNSSSPISPLDLKIIEIQQKSISTIVKQGADDLRDGKVRHWWDRHLTVEERLEKLEDWMLEYKDWGERMQNRVNSNIEEDTHEKQDIVGMIDMLNNKINSTINCSSRVDDQLDEMLNV